MKRVVIVRHAKAVQYNYDNDFERDLTTKGEHEADLISRHLSKLRVTPDLVISSPANRARQTAEIFADNLGYLKEKILFEEKLYSGKSPENFLNMLRKTEEGFNTVFVFGHNPSVSYYMGYLLRDFDKDVPTCSTVAIDFSVDSWEGLQQRSGETGLRIIPDMLKK